MILSKNYYLITDYKFFLQDIFMTELIDKDLLNNIKSIINSAKSKAYKAINFAMVEAYWHIGKAIVEDEQKGKDRAEYGKELIQALSKQLSSEFGKGFSAQNLWNMRKMYERFPILQTLSRELSWSHYCQLFRVDSEEKRNWYVEEAAKNSWSVRQLQRQINSFYFERIISAKDKKLLSEESEKLIKQIPSEAVIKDPFILEFLGLPEKSNYRESTLEQKIIDNLQNFLLELGSGFSFVARQKRVTLENDHFFLDLVFYNYILKCFVVIDLKIGELSYQDIGQIDMYVRIFDEQYRNDGDNPTIGLILCSEKNNTVIKYSVLDDKEQLFASEYKTVLPSEEELQAYINKQVQNNNEESNS